MKRFLGYAIAAAILVVAAVVLIVIPRGSSAEGDRRSWFQTPADGDRVTTGQVTVVAGATDPMGIAVLELSVDDEFVEGRLYEGAPERVSAEFTWQTPLPGAFRLTVHARGTDGTWGDPETIVVEAVHPVGSTVLVPGATTTTGPLSDLTTTTGAGSTTSTSRVCPSAEPSLLRPADEAVVDGQPALEWVYPGEDTCPPERQTLEFSGPPYTGGEELRIELPLRVTSWQPPHLEDCASYRWHLVAESGGKLVESPVWRFSTDFGGDC